MSYVELGSLSAGQRFLFRDWETYDGVYEVNKVSEGAVYVSKTLGGPIEAYNRDEKVCVFLSGKNDFPNSAST